LNTHSYSCCGVDHDRERARDHDRGRDRDPDVDHVHDTGPDQEHDHDRVPESDHAIDCAPDSDIGALTFLNEWILIVPPTVALSTSAAASTIVPVSVTGSLPEPMPVIVSTTTPPTQTTTASPTPIVTTRMTATLLSTSLPRTSVS
jgi:hypothetical protein